MTRHARSDPRIQRFPVRARVRSRAASAGARVHRARDRRGAGDRRHRVADPACSIRSCGAIRAMVAASSRAPRSSPASGAFATEVGSVLDDEQFARRVQLRPVRTQSGVTPLTVLTKPFPCPGRCIFCPNDVRMPKSYLSDEPGAQRAAQQSLRSLSADLESTRRLSRDRPSHRQDRADRVSGAPGPSIPRPYQIWFAKRCFDAMNDFGAGVDRRVEDVRIATPDIRPQTRRLSAASAGRLQRRGVAST